MSCDKSYVHPYVLVLTFLKLHRKTNLQNDTGAQEICWLTSFGSQPLDSWEDVGGFNRWLSRIVEE